MNDIKKYTNLAILVGLILYVVGRFTNINAIAIIGWAIILCALVTTLMKREYFSRFGVIVAIVVLVLFCLSVIIPFVL